MVLLGEAEDDAHLSPAERVEERLGSVDYDVWSCPSCAHAVKLRYGAFFTSYSRCPKCRAITVSRTTRTLRSATHSGTGLEEITERCEHCSYRHADRRRIPRLASPPTSAPGAGSSSGSSGSPGSSSGFSGGSSSGGGASGSW
jgi:uncharacterized protein